MKRVRQIELKAGMTVDQLVAELGGAGVQGAGNLAKACDILERMVREKATVFLGLSGPMVPSGLRNIITWFIREGHVSAVVTSGANVVHDMVEAFGGAHYKGSYHGDDEKLRKEEIGRIGNVYTRIPDFQVFEDRVQEILSGIDEEGRGDLSVRELLDIIGANLEDENSFLRAAHKTGVPVFSPGVTDSMLGLQLFFFAERNHMVLNVVKDMKELSDMVFEAEKSGAIFLGGGVPKHYILGANLLREGIDYGIQVTLDREEGGGLSGAKLEEAVSWSKAKSGANIVTVIGDATAVFPVMAASLMERLA